MRARPVPLLVLHCGAVATVGWPLRAQQEAPQARIALFRIELPHVPTDSGRAFAARIADALESDATTSATVMAPDEVVRRLEATRHLETWDRVVFTFVPAGIVDPIDLAAVCESLDVDRIVHVEAAGFVDRGPVHAGGQVLLGTRAALRAWSFDCRALALAWERWGEGSRSVTASTDIDAAGRVPAAGAVSSAVDALARIVRP
jgi:hypothetical protein